MALFRLIATLCLYVHILCGSAAAQERTIDAVFQVTNILAVDGRAVAVCTVNKLGSDVLSSIVWRHNGTLVVPIPNRIIIRTDLDEGTSELEVDSLVPSDAGTYACQATFSIPSGTVLMDSITLIVATALVVTAAEEQDFLEGDIANLTCSAFSSPLPGIQWFRINEDGSETTLTGRQEAEDDNFGVYRIVNVKSSNGGLYRCEGSYVFGRESVMIRLFITAFPEIVTPPRINFEVVKGENLTLDCETASQRPPNYVWSFEGEELFNSSRVSVGATTGQLNVSNVTFADAGTYNCYVDNDLGNDTQNNTVLVAGAPEIITPNDTVTFAGAGNRAALNCSFLAHPLPTTVWSKLSENDYVPLNINSNARLSINATNGSLLISEAVGNDRGNYSCIVSNTFGNDTRFNITLKVIELAPPPSMLRIIDDTRDRSLPLQWEYDDLNTLPEYRMPEHFIVEARLDDNLEYELLDQYFPPNHTADIVVDLIPGTQFHIRIRAANLAGFSEPTNAVLHTTNPSIPQFLFFNATALDDGRSILLRWELEFDGGPDVSLFEVEFFDSSGTLLDTFELDINDGSYLIENLDPLTTYSFSAVALNDIGATAPITAEATTPLAPPNKPTQPIIVERTIQSLAFSFSVEFGSRPIDYFVLNITEDMTELLQLNFSVTDDQYIEELSDVLSEESGEVIGYFVVIRVRDELENEREYVFEVAAGSEVGMGEFSNSSNPFSLKDERVIYYIIAAVVGGVIVVIVVIIVVIAIACCVKRFRRRSRTMLITGKHTISTTSTDFMLKEERYNTDVDTGIGNVDRADTASPYYNKLNQYHNGGQSYGIDEPDARFSTSPSSIPNSHVQNRLSGQSSTLPRASVGSGPTYPDSTVSNKTFPGSPPGTLKGADPTISFSTPAINDRYSSDMDPLQKSTSYMTDV